MASVFGPLQALRTRLSPRGRGWIDRLVYEVIYSLPGVARRGFFNSGCHPPPAGLLAVPELADAPAQAALYHLALQAMTGGRPRAPHAVLDIGCGAGGGLLYAAALFPGAELAGLDISRRAVAAARRRCSAEIRVGRADRLPFADGRFDLVVSIGTLTYVAYGDFLREAARVLMPGGVLTVTGGTMDTPIGWTRARLGMHARACGLAERSFAEITEQTRAGLAAQAPRNAELVARLPWPLRHQAREWAALPGTQRHRAQQDGSGRDFAACYEKTG